MMDEPLNPKSVHWDIQWMILFLYRTLLQVLLQGTLKRLTHRILSLESATNPEGAGDE